MIFSAAKYAKDANVKRSGIDLTKNHWKFPIQAEKRDVIKHLDKMCNPDGFPIEVKDLVLSFEPYNKKNTESLLFALNTAANVNKHKFLTQTNLRSGSFDLKHVSGPKTVANSENVDIDGGGNTFKTVPSDAPVGTDEIGLYFSLYRPQTIYEVSLTVDIKFYKIKGLEDRTCVFQLSRIADICEDVVVRMQGLYKILNIL